MKLKIIQKLAKLNKLKRAMKSQDYLEEIAVTAETDVLMNFETEGGNIGKGWKRSQRAIKQGGKTLRSSGTLFNSIHHVVINNVAEVRTNLNVGSYNLAEIHDRGMGHQPVRKFMELSESVKKEFPVILRKHLL